MEKMPARALLRTLIETTGDLVCVKDLNGRYLMVNPAAAQLLGSSPEDVVGKTDADLLLPELAARLEAEDRRVMATENPSTTEEHRTHAGSTRTYLTHRTPYRDSGGQIAGLIVIRRDTTERRSAEESLDRRSRALGERIKELTCLYSISALVERPGVSLAEILQGTVELIPPAWPYPENTCARIRLDDQEFRSEGFRDTGRHLTVDLTVCGQRHGFVEVCCRGDRQPAIDDPSLREERSLLNAIAERLGRVVERFWTTERLESANQRLEAILEHTPMMVAVLDPHLNFVLVNHAYAAADERDPAFFPGKSHFELYPNPENEQIFRRVVQTGEPYYVLAKPFEYAEHLERGVSYWDWSLVPIQDSAGEVEGLLLTLSNATDRIQAQQALRESEEKFRQLAENVRDAFWLGTTGIGEQRQVLYVNPAFAKVFGITEEEILKSDRAWLDAVDPDDRERTLKALEDFLQGGVEDYDVEYRIARANGETRWIWARGFAIRDDRGRFYRTAGLAQDVTERKAVEKELQRYQESLEERVRDRTADLEAEIAERRRVEQDLARSYRFVSALNQVSARIQMTLDPGEVVDSLGAALQSMGLHSAVAIRGPDRGPLSIRYVSISSGALSRFEAEAGFSPLGQRIPEKAWLVAELLRQGQALFLPDQRSVAEALMPRVSREELDRRCRLLDLKQDHPAVLLPLIAEEQIFGLLVVWGEDLREEDVPGLSVFADQVGNALERARLSRHAAEAEILREVDRLRSELIANVSHEIRTPLGLIEVLSTSLLMDDVDFDGEVQREFLLGIKEATDRLRAIVENLLDLSRLESGRLILHKRPTDLAELVRQVAASMAAQAADHRLVLELEGRDLVAAADAGQMERVLVNLLSNAIKYSPAGATIRVAGRAEAEHVVLWVSDEGIGIPAEEQEQIFERFYRVESETTRQVAGVGLGLAVCRGIVEAHGGRIWVESQPGKGSTFRVSLPVDGK